MPPGPNVQGDLNSWPQGDGAPRPLWTVILPSLEMRDVMRAVWLEASRRVGGPVVVLAGVDLAGRLISLRVGFWAVDGVELWWVSAEWLWLRHSYAHWRGFCYAIDRADGGLVKLLFNALNELWHGTRHLEFLPPIYATFGRQGLTVTTPLDTCLHAARPETLRAVAAKLDALAARAKRLACNPVWRGAVGTS